MPTGSQWGGIALGGASLLPMLFGGGDSSLDEPLKALRGQADTASDLAKTLGKQGQDLLGPATDYLKALISGDRQALLGATMPERRRVIDQYSTAKKTIGEFAPRGGGQAAAMTKLEAGKASDLAEIGAGARSKAVTTSLGAGLQEQGLGLGALGISGQDLGSLIYALSAKEQRGQGTAAALGQALGTIAGMIFKL